MQAYSDPSRENDPHALPDIEVFQDGACWFYWYCFPGCLPDSEAIGPYDTAQDALNAARDEGMA